MCLIECFVCRSLNFTACENSATVMYFVKAVVMLLQKMAASASDLKERVRDIVKCPICLEDYKDPRSLPCLHTFCFRCIEDFAANHQLQAGSLACPICRKKFTLGDQGVAGLPSNFVIADLLDAEKVEKDALVHTLCEVCSSVNGAAVESRRATVYCAECGQFLCDSCSMPHKTLQDGGHQILSLEEYAVMAEQCGPQMDADMAQMSQRVSEIQSKLHQLDVSSTTFSENADQIEMSVKKKAAEMKQLIDRQMNELLEELQTVIQKVTEDVSSLRQSLETSLVFAESFTAYSKELRKKGKPCDMSKAASDLHSRAVELQNVPLSSVESCVPQVVFRPCDFNEISRMFGTASSLIGQLAVFSGKHDMMYVHICLCLFVSVTDDVNILTMLRVTTLCFVSVC